MWQQRTAKTIPAAVKNNNWLAEAINTRTCSSFARYNMRYQITHCFEFSWHNKLTTIGNMLNLIKIVGIVLPKKCWKIFLFLICWTVILIQWEIFVCCIWIWCYSRFFWISHVSNNNLTNWNYFFTDLESL